MADDAWLLELAESWPGAPLEMPPDDTAEPLTATPDTMRRARRLARMVLRSDAPPWKVALLVEAMDGLLAQRRARLAGDEVLIARLRERAGLA